MYANLSYRYFLALLLAICLWSCSNEKLVEVELPEYTSQMVVECYLEPGKPFQLALQESVDYFAEPQLPPILGALVTVSYLGQTDTLYDGLFTDPISGNFYNYRSNTIVPEAYGEEFELYIRDLNGREARATAMMLDTVNPNPVAFDVNDQGKISGTFSWPDFSGEENYYIFSLHHEGLEESPAFFFSLDDRVGDGEDFTISTFYFMDPGDEIIHTTYQISKEYWNYVNTTNDATNSNGNPFAQPSNVLSNVDGAIGIFTALSRVRRTVLVP